MLETASAVAARWLIDHASPHCTSEENFRFVVEIAVIPGTHHRKRSEIKVHDHYEGSAPVWREGR